jgi:hypothetical protein
VVRIHHQPSQLQQQHPKPIPKQIRIFHYTFVIFQINLMNQDLRKELKGSEQIDKISFKLLISFRKTTLKKNIETKLK